MQKSTAVLLILLILTMGFVILIALNSNAYSPVYHHPIIQTTNTVTLKNMEITSTGNLTNSLVLRNISINNFGIATVTDTFIVRNDGTNSTKSANVLYPENVWSELITYTAWHENIQLNTERIFSGGVNGTQIIFHKSLSPGDNYTFTLKQYFKGTLSTVSSQMRFSFPAYPYSPYRTEECRVSVILPKGAYSTSSLKYNYANISPFDANNTLGINFTFNDGSSIVSLKTVYRQVTVDPWMGINVIEVHLIENKGVSNLNKTYFQAPAGTVKFEANDAAGTLTSWPAGDSVEIYTRYSIPPNGTYVYYLTYSIPIAFSQIGSSGTYLLAFNIVPNYGGIIENFYISLIFSNFLGISFQSPPTLPITSINKNIYLYTYKNIIPTQNILSYFLYSVGFPNTYLRPLTLTLVFGSAAAVYALVRSRRVKAAPAIVRPAEVKASILSEFLNLYEEKNTLILEMERLREDALRKKVSKLEYAQRIKNSEKELARLESEINKIKTKLIEADKKYVSDIRYFEINEADREQAKLALQSLRRRYLMKRLDKETYLKLKEAQENKLRKAESNLDKRIQDLRRETI